jgi:hypothetical protein
MALVLEQTGEIAPAVIDLPLSTVAGLLAQAALYVGHDSGLTHLAGALGLPTVAIFGPTEPTRWAPRGKLVSVIRGPACLCHDWASVTSCHEKPCLSIPFSELLTSCHYAIHRREEHLKSPGQSPSSSCSDKSGCARLTR